MAMKTEMGDFWKTLTGIYLKKRKVILKLAVILLLITAFSIGRLAAIVKERNGARETASEGNWGLSFQQEGETPVGNATMEELAKYDAWYAAPGEDKVIYLTFDCGYENGNTPAILAALKKHKVPAAFFVVGNFLADNPELVKQMAEEGHTVGNHTCHHPDMSRISDKESFQNELKGVEDLYREITGQEIPRFYRPPQGKYSEANLKMAQELSYQTFFWSLAYVDWYEEKQPSREEAFEKLLGRIHPGAIVLLHNTSSTNAAILDELLSKWEEMGYRFGRLEDIAKESAHAPGFVTAGLHSFQNGIAEA